MSANANLNPDQPAPASPLLMYEIINPSDCVTILAPNFEVALLTILIIGNGKIGGKPVNHKGPDIPLFMFGGFQEWFDHHYPDQNINSMLEKHNDAIIVALRTACTGSPANRKEFDQAMLVSNPAQRTKFLADWDEQRRTSKSQIANFAHQTADTLEAKANAKQPNTSRTS